MFGVTFVIVDVVCVVVVMSTDCLQLTDCCCFIGHIDVCIKLNILIAIVSSIFAGIDTVVFNYGYVVTVIGRYVFLREKWGVIRWRIFFWGVLCVKRETGKDHHGNGWWHYLLYSGETV